MTDPSPSEHGASPVGGSENLGIVPGGFFARRGAVDERSVMPEPLTIRLTAGDAEMVVSWSEEALRKLCPDNSVLRESVARFREAFNAAAKERLSGNA